MTKKYPEEVRILRRKANQTLGIVVGTDADELTVVRRTEQLADALRHTPLEPRSDTERIVLWIPKWNVETWILYFDGDVRDEDRDYKHDVTNKKVNYKEISKRFVGEFRDCKQGRANPELSSLKSAYEETERLRS